MSMLEPDDEGEIVIGQIHVELVMGDGGTFPRVTFDEHMESWQGLGALEYALLQLRTFIQRPMIDAYYHNMEEEEDESD